MVGIDEVGRGCLAGPLLVAAARAKGPLPDGLKDSKTLSRNQRQLLLSKLVKACEFGEGWATPAEIDRLGLSAALRLGVARAVRQLGVSSHEPIIIDGPINYLPKKFIRVTTMINADASVALVSAASIYAKVVRDKHMINLGDRHPRYGFNSNVGYGTAEHLAALKSFGALKQVHRFSFAPLRQTGLL